MLLTLVSWILQGFLAVIFLIHGIVLLKPPVRMKEAIGAIPFQPWFPAFLGVAEIAAFFGLLLPGLLGIATWLIPLAAGGLLIITIGAIFFHLSHHEGKQAMGLVLLSILLLCIAYLRWHVVPL